MFRPVCSEEQYPTWIAFLSAALSSFLFDFLIRPVVDKHIKGYTLRRVPWPSPEGFGNGAIDINWVLARVIELVYTTPEFSAVAEDCGWNCPPFSIDEERGFQLRCELDAALFFRYLPHGTEAGWAIADDHPVGDVAHLCARFPEPRDAVAFIMDAFPIVRRKDEDLYNGDYRTKRVILEIYDAMQDAARAGQPYQTRLDPPPADSRCGSSWNTSASDGDPV